MKKKITLLIAAGLALNSGLIFAATSQEEGSSQGTTTAGSYSDWGNWDSAATDEGAGTDGQQVASAGATSGSNNTSGSNGDSGNTASGADSGVSSDTASSDVASTNAGAETSFSDATADLGSVGDDASLASDTAYNDTSFDPSGVDATNQSETYQDTIYEDNLSPSKGMTAYFSAFTENPDRGVGVGTLELTPDNTDLADGEETGGTIEVVITDYDAPADNGGGDQSLSMTFTSNDDGANIFANTSGDLVFEGVASGDTEDSERNIGGDLYYSTEVGREDEEAYSMGDFFGIGLH